jgi:hypothetical protein
MKTIRLGDIGKERKRIKIIPMPEPAEAPVTEPAAPVEAPAEAPVVPEPVPA